VFRVKFRKLHVHFGPEQWQQQARKSLILDKASCSFKAKAGLFLFPTQKFFVHLLNSTQQTA
jgi:hypothetical protein